MYPASTPFAARARARHGLPRLVLVHENAMRRAFQIVELAGFGRPDKTGNHGRDEQDGDGDEEIEDFHIYECAATGCFVSDTRSLRRKAFATTMSELADMPSAAIHGATQPAAANGRAIRL